MINKIINEKDGEWRRRWVGWWGVETICGHYVSREFVERRWNPEAGYLSLIDPYDYGEYSGAWEYRLINGANAILTNLMGEEG